MGRWEYVCRYCQASLGSIDGSFFSEEELGLDKLTPQERADIISERGSDNDYQVRVVCEFCQRSLEEDPERSLAPYLFH